jgi:hypothetical protein
LITSLDDGYASSLDVSEVAKSIEELNDPNIVSFGIIQNADGRRWMQQLDAAYSLFRHRSSTPSMREAK